MEYEFTKQFLKDLNRFRSDRKFFQHLGAKINHIYKVASVNSVDGLELIRGTSSHYRFKIKTEKNVYRIGIKRIKKVIWFACIDSDKKRFYKRFP